MDPRGVYIVQTQDQFWIVIGQKCIDRNLSEYIAYAWNYI